jgi:hypothetical protein
MPSAIFPPIAPTTAEPGGAGIDFATLVLGPAMEVFSRPVTVTPLASQPDQPAYFARGIFEVRNIDVPVEGGIMSSQIITLGVRLAEFDVPPGPGDKVELPMPDGSVGGPYLIDDTDDDSEGGSTWTLKAIES